jgi:hypothetical protein
MDATGYTLPTGRNYSGVINESELKLAIDPYTDIDEGRTASLYLKGSNGITDVPDNNAG